MPRSRGPKYSQNGPSLCLGSWRPDHTTGRRYLECRQKISRGWDYSQQQSMIFNHVRLAAAAPPAVQQRRSPPMGAWSEVGQTVAPLMDPQWNGGGGSTVRPNL